MAWRRWKWHGLGLMWLVVLGVVPVASAQEGSLQEAEALNQQVLQLYQQGRFNDAFVPIGHWAPLTQPH